MRTRRFVWVSIVAICAGLLGTFAPLPADDKPADKVTEKPAEKAVQFEVEKFKDIAYRTDKDADKERHKLDIYCPKGQKDFPVILFVHGGTWKMGNKNLYTAIGETFAKAGIGMVITNYRLSPAVQHPAHVEDVAKAFAWVVENIGKYNGSPEKLFICGHSAGGHLVSLLATDPSYLKAEKHSFADIKGVIPISGVFQITPVAPLKQAFGTDAEVCKQASPLTHVTGKHPPFLIAYADSELPTLDTMAKDMHKALQKVESPTELMECKNCNHITIILKFVNQDDQLNKAVREFVKAKCK
jgi:acetyl esterase/lipase